MQNQFQALFQPRGVIVAGSASPGKLGNILISRLVAGGFPHIYAVNPKGEGAHDVPGFTSAKDIGAPVDLVVVASPASAVCDVLRDCGQAGVGAAIIITSGFGEAGHPELEEELKAVAAEYGIRYTGPNCAGMINTHVQLIASLEAAPPQGSTALISQSGAVGGAIMDAADTFNLGISKFVSYGNGSDLDEMAFLRYLRDDPETKVIAMYVENIKNGRAFMEVLREVTAVKPVVIIKSGRTATGQRATLSHTGSLAGADAVYDAAFAACGAIRVESIEEMLDLCKGFAMLPPATGNRLLIVTNSGGPAVMTADKADEVGLEVPEPSKELKSVMSQYLPSFASLNNPVDITVEGSGAQYGQATMDGLQSDEYDAAVVVYIGTPYLQAVDTAERIAQAAKETDKPILTMMQVGTDIKESIAALAEAGVPNYASGERAAWVIAQMHTYQKYLTKTVGAHHDAPGRFVNRPYANKSAVEPKDTVILEPDGMKLLAENGISVPLFYLIKQREEVAQVVAKLEFPLVMKIVSPDIIHKSDVGGVRLNIKSPEEAITAFDELLAITKGLRFEGVITYSMLKKGEELITGLMRDPQFGPVILFGMGGIYSEILRDVAIRVAPVSIPEAREMIASIRAYPILKGARGQAGVDIEALAEMISNFSELPFMYPWIYEADLNPVFAYEKGYVAVDCRILKGNA